MTMIIGIPKTIRVLRYLKCEECKVLIWEGSGPMICPKCGIDIISKTNTPTVIFKVKEQNNSLLMWEDDMWKVRRTICLTDLTAKEINELLLLNPIVNK